MRNEKGQFIKGEELKEYKREWWKNLDKEDKVKLIDKQTKSRNLNKHPSLNKKGPNSYGWKGGTHTTKRDGYIYVWAPNHPNKVRGGKGGGGYILEHRLVMEKMIGRYLYKDEDVNHINGNKKDNRPENLKLVRHNAHYEERECPKCSFQWWTR